MAYKVNATVSSSNYLVYFYYKITSNSYTSGAGKSTVYFDFIIEEKNGYECETTGFSGHNLIVNGTKYPLISSLNTNDNILNKQYSLFSGNRVDTSSSSYSFPKSFTITHNNNGSASFKISLDSTVSAPAGGYGPGTVTLSETTVTNGFSSLPYKGTLTVNYYSNYADKSFSGSANTVSGTTNVLVRTARFLHDSKYSDGLHNYSTADSGTYLGRTGYKGTGYWGTSTTSTTTDSTSVNENTSFTTGADLAKKLGKSLSGTDATVNLYPIWEPYILTLRLHCNGADYVKVTGTSSGVTPCEYSGSSANNYIVTETLKYYDTAQYGLSNGDNKGHIFMSRTGYKYKQDTDTGMGMWNTKADGTGISAHWGERDHANMGSLIKDLFNVDYSNSNQTLDLYIMWEPIKLTVTFNNVTNNLTLEQDFYYDASLNQFGYNSDGTPKWEMTGQFGEWQFIGYKLLGWTELSTAQTVNYEIYQTIDNNFILTKCNDGNNNYVDSTLSLFSVLEETTLTINYHTNGADYATFDQNNDNDITTFTEQYYGEDAGNKVFSQRFTYFQTEKLNTGLARPDDPYFINITKTGYGYSVNEDNIYQWNTTSDGTGTYYRANDWKPSSEITDTDNRGVWAKEFLNIDFSTQDAVLDLYMIWVKSSPNNVMYVKHTDGKWYRGELFVKNNEGKWYRSNNIHVNENGVWM